MGYANLAQMFFARAAELGVKRPRECVLPRRFVQAQITACAAAAHARMQARMRCPIRDYLRPIRCSDPIPCVRNGGTNTRRATYRSLSVAMRTRTMASSTSSSRV